VNLAAYFSRIGWRGPVAATPTVLAGLLAHHMRAIHFENLDVLLGRRVRLEVDALEAKLVTARRGGYCYEHATLFAAVLEHVGFPIKTHSARVVMLTPRALAPRTHMFLTVGDVMLDPGFGGLAPLVPVPLDGTPAGDHRLVRDGNVHVLEFQSKPLWVSTLEHDQPVDFEMANHFTSTFPSSPFVNRLMLRAFTDDGRIAVMNRDVSVYRGETVVESYQLADRAALRELVATHFDVDLPELATVRVPAIAEWS
jgi:N-hydroxyarylamine O-acetyltransferase